ncbi:hypothetical protein [Thioalkalivibrio sp. ALJ24]|uniref:hypothetical protein n=1 Tax=Thioalkalivibrio sp. ALJ24 TaxID=545276 RepID=UPI00035FE670|nr:hypothetical protein [Thioalkalivibrio sp. ALJ24]
METLDLQVGDSFRLGADIEVVVVQAGCDGQIRLVANAPGHRVQWVDNELLIDRHIRVRFDESRPGRVVVESATPVTVIRGDTR